MGNPSPTGGGGGATNTPAPPTATPTPGAGPWVKLKDSSHFSRTALYNNIPTSPIIYDSEDTTQPYYILGASGVVGAPSVNITGLNANAKTGSPEYKIGYTPTTYAMTPNNFISYMKSRKEYTKITSVDQITGAGIYYLEFDLTSGATVSATLTSVPAAFNSNNVVLVTNGEIDINMANFNPTNSVAIIADIIKFNASVTQANGLFLANSIYTGVTSNQGLKINGNFVAQQYFANQRKWSSNSRPSFFTVFKPKLYLDLLPYLSIVNYEWKQLQ